MKKFLGALALTIVAAALCAYAESVVAPKKVSWNNDQLVKMFQAQDDEYFGGRLPKNAIVHWQDIPLDSDGTYVMGLMHYFPESDSYEIDIDTKTNITMSTAYATLEHEECHVANDVDGVTQEDPHGPAFQKCMLDLASEGAMKGVW